MWHKQFRRGLSNVNGEHSLTLQREFRSGDLDDIGKLRRVTSNVHGVNRSKSGLGRYQVPGVRKTGVGFLPLLNW